MDPVIQPTQSEPGDRAALPASAGSPETDSPSPQSSGWLDGRASAIFSILSGFLVFAVVISRNTWIFSTRVSESGDFAANSILVDKASQFDLLVGHESRLGFHHPGPFFLYVQSWGETLFHDITGLVPGEFNAQVLSIVVLNSVLAGLCAFIVGRRVRPVWLCLIVPVAVLAIPMLLPGALTSTWPPHAFVMPFLLLLIASGSVLGGQTKDLPFAILAMCMLGHGYVSFAVFVIAFAAVITLGLIVRWRRGNLRLSRGTIIASAVILAVFVLPIVLNLILNWPGEIAKYVEVAQDVHSHTIGQAARFFSALFEGQTSSALSYGVAALALILASLLAVLAKRTQPDASRLLVGMLAAAVLATFLTVYYVMFGMDDLRPTFTYAAWFFYAVPATIGIVLGLGLGVQASKKRVWQALFAAVIALLAVVTVIAPGQAAAYLGDRDIAPATKFIADQTPPGGQVILSFKGLALVPTLGIAEEANRTGLNVCIDNAVPSDVGAHLFTPERMCTDAQMAAGRVVQVSTLKVGEPIPPKLKDSYVGTMPLWDPQIDRFVVSFSN